MCPLILALRRTQGLETVPWNQVSGSRPRPACLPKSSSLKLARPRPSRPPGLGDGAEACGPQERRCSLNTAGLMGWSHIWFSFKCPNVIKFSPMQRKSLVRCGFPPSIKVKKSQSLIPPADPLSSPPLVCPSLNRKGLYSDLFPRADGGEAPVGCPEPPTPLSHLPT